MLMLGDLDLPRVCSKTTILVQYITGVGKLANQTSMQYTDTSSDMARLLVSTHSNSIQKSLYVFMFPTARLARCLFSRMSMLDTNLH